MRKIVPYKSQAKVLARGLRKNMTPWERKLWYEFLRGAAPRFLRQKPLGGAIVDFYCPTLKLAIELDGGQHFEADGLERDARRTSELERLGIKVLRYSNLEIDRDFEGVCQSIQSETEERRSDLLGSI